MARNAPKAPPTTSLGTFSHEEATEIAHFLAHAAIKATVVRLYGGPRDDQPTEWWHVRVPNRSTQWCETWLRGWRAGKEYHLVESYRRSHGISYADAAQRLGYGPPSDPAEHLGHNGACGTLPCLESAASVHLLWTRGGTECGKSGPADADINLVTCPKCLARHAEKTGGACPECGSTEVHHATHDAGVEHQCAACGHAFGAFEGA